MNDERSRGASGAPSTDTFPVSEGSTPARHSNSVVLPAPLGPMRPRISPARIDSETSDSAVRRSYDFVRCSTSTRVVIASDAPRFTTDRRIQIEKSIGRVLVLPVVVDGGDSLRSLWAIS